MNDKRAANMILSRTRRNQIYLPYAKKRPYFEAIEGGDADAIGSLAEENRGYPQALAAKCDSEEEALERMRYGSVGAADEMCLTAIRAGLLDMVAYDIRDELIARLRETDSLTGCYDLVHETARDYAVRMGYVLKGKKYSPRLVRMMTYIEEHLGEKIELAAIAAHVNVSRTYASAIFKDELGITISGFILGERMLEAKRMLRDTDLPVAEIARRLSFCSQSYFTKNFTQTEGMTPLEYRRMSS